ncbi:hypothetical protein [Nocardia veterana]|uniref:Integral membrane protein n=1 Tax=Nocardia veterana TaxID=132249 RepID=A0A7X6RJL1_9NOCA|nr:hypothetical protein [Nocardia veterana]NKY88372.1 hypothetical protein [Nocardia veterana]
MRTACQLWWAVIALGVLRLILGAVDGLGNRHRVAQDFYDQLHGERPEFSVAQMELVVSILEVLILTYGLGIVVGAVAMTHQLGRGRLWARTVADVATVVLVLGAVGSMFGLGTVSGGMTVAIGAATILQAVLACGAVFLCHRTESAAYFGAVGR